MSKPPLPSAIMLHHHRQHAVTVSYRSMPTYRHFGRCSNDPPVGLDLVVGGEEEDEDRALALALGVSDGADGQVLNAVACHINTIISVIFMIKSDCCWC